MSTIEPYAHSYPRGLAEQIWSLWNRSDGRNTVLQSVETLNSFLSVAYQASLLREEGRPVECRITLSEPKNLDPVRLASIGFHLVRFTKRRSFAEQEIRRLGAATGFYRAMIVVEWSASSGFEISGMLHTGAWSRDLTVAIDSLNHPIPDWLIIHVRGPGNLVIHRGSERLVTLLNGRVEGHGFDLFASSWLLERYRTVGEGFSDEKAPHPLDSVNVLEDLAEKIGIGFMRRVIREIRNSQHGGTIVFAPRSLVGRLLEVRGPLRAKYRIDEACTASPFAVILAEVTRRLGQFALAKGRIVGRLARVPGLV